MLFNLVANLTESPFCKEFHLLLIYRTKVDDNAFITLCATIQLSSDTFCPQSLLTMCYLEMQSLSRLQPHVHRQSLDIIRPA